MEVAVVDLAMASEAEEVPPDWADRIWPDLDGGSRRRRRIHSEDWAIFLEEADWAVVMDKEVGAVCLVFWVVVVEASIRWLVSDRRLVV